MSPLKNWAFCYDFLLYFHSAHLISTFLDFLLFLKTHYKTYCSPGWLVASHPLGDTDQTSCPPLSLLPYTLHIPRTMLHFHSGALRRPRTGLGQFTWITALNHPLDFRSKPGAQLAVVFYISVGGSVFIFSLAIGFSIQITCFSQAPFPALVCPVTAVLMQLQVWKRTDFIDFLFSFFFYNEGIIALLCSSLANHQTRGKTNCLFSSSDAG